MPVIVKETWQRWVEAQTAIGKHCRVVFSSSGGFESEPVMRTSSQLHYGHDTVGL